MQPSAQTAAEIQVMLSYQPLGLVRGNARDIRLDGMVVDTGVVSLSRDAEVGVTLAYHKGDELRVHRVDAAVTTSSREGHSLRFLPYDSEVHRALEEMMAATAH